MVVVVASKGLLIPEGWWCSQDNKLGCHGNQLPSQHLHQAPSLPTQPASPIVEKVILQPAVQTIYRVEKTIYRVEKLLKKMQEK